MGIVQGLEWTGCYMRCVVVMILGMSLSGCWAMDGSTYSSATDPAESMSRFPFLMPFVVAQGELPVAALLTYLRSKEAVAKYPSGELPASSVLSDGSMRIIDAVREIERACGWVYQPETRNFYTARATHEIDDPDAFGNPQNNERASLDARPMVSLSFRFRRIQAGLSADEASAGSVVTQFTATLPDGVRSQWSSVTERSFFEGVRDAANPDAQSELVETKRGIVQSGIEVSGIAARLPGFKFRIDGQLAISAFTGGNLDRAVLNLPLQIDAERGQWVRTLIIRGGDVSARAAFRHFDIDFNATGEAIELLVRVD